MFDLRAQNFNILHEVMLQMCIVRRSMIFFESMKLLDQFRMSNPSGLDFVARQSRDPEEARRVEGY
ncbi:hypothetical protein [Mesorhizobium sp. ES1-4]|uniref:hypothetical protein n=1 Tax=Mesorhizobium sp. ES1-4 TaxID=2876627 RepID=UPI001CCB7C01|nr:hypothetical protein [Mesorhizobium sp. ES1-4]MBZ9797753.1 hypothetical protein [Mesorhizobium sp. ES1-4]